MYYYINFSYYPFYLSIRLKKNKVQKISNWQLLKIRLPLPFCNLLHEFLLNVFWVTFLYFRNFVIQFHKYFFLPMIVKQLYWCVMHNTLIIEIAFYLIYLDHPPNFPPIEFPNNSCEISIRIPHSKPTAPQFSRWVESISGGVHRCSHPDPTNRPAEATKLIYI